MFNCKQLSALLGISNTTVSEWIKRGFLTPSARDSNAKLFTVDDIRAAIAKHNLRVHVTPELTRLMAEAWSDKPLERSTTEKQP